MQQYQPNTIGKTIQIFSFSKLLLTKNPLIIQTYGIKHDQYIQCANPRKIKKAILNNLCKDSFVIFDFSTLINTHSLVYLFRFLNCLGRNVYLVTSKKEKLWFADEVYKLE
ncbi:hypothetical protein H312_02442 [Anncaliia algerae PRA339]|uniref:Uncharacterized protein n=1 Tax=Anncaliia algerae PRA339 TaxID=1288291 RepID=A0A059EZK9_9MICR|nr:hypothetical protein H312_02442 [Anncaliia algerae PRA339]